MPQPAVDFDWDGFWERFGDYSTSVPGTVYRQRLIFEQLGALGSTDRLLDIGCGLGELVEALHHAYPRLRSGRPTTPRQPSRRHEPGCPMRSTSSGTS